MSGLTIHRRDILGAAAPLAMSSLMWPRLALAGPAACPQSLVGEPLVWRLDRLQAARARVQAKDPSLQPALDRLRAEAVDALSRGPYTVTDKSRPPPSGDLKDYTSIGPYWWPNPDTPDGLPYVRRDGQTNPERAGPEFDRVRIYALVADVQTLGLAHWFTGEARFAEHAEKLLRVWFIDPDTAMNPNLNYAQAIPGKTDGRGIGIIDTHKMGGLIDAAQLLLREGALSRDVYTGLRVWFAAFTKWLVTSPLGQDERAAKNNHGTYYDLQLLHYSLFVGDCDFARKRLKDLKTRIDSQITVRGRMPLEEKRTRSLHYYVFNSFAFLHAARLFEHLNEDLHGYVGRRGQALPKVLDYLTPYIGRDEDWPHEQIGSSSQDNLAALMLEAALVYPQLETAARRAAQRLVDGRARLLNNVVTSA